MKSLRSDKTTDGEAVLAVRIYRGCRLRRGSREDQGPLLVMIWWFSTDLTHSIVPRERLA